MELKINRDFAGRKVLHGKINKTVGEHNQQELRELAIQARRSGNRILIECFVELPELDKLLEEKTTAQIAATNGASDKGNKANTDNKGNPIA